jgi:N-acetylmuramoyl-L-alanine amidase
MDSGFRRNDGLEAVRWQRPDSEVRRRKSSKRRRPGYDDPVVNIRVSGLASCALALLLLASALQAQNLKPASPYTVVSREGRRIVQAVVSGDQDMLRAEDLAAVFQLSVREDRSNNALTVTRGGRTAVLSLDQGLASIGGRLVSLAAPPARDGGRWVVPVDFVSRALSLISDTRMELRRSSRLIVVGEVHVPRVSARLDQTGAATRVTLDLSPGAPHTVSQEARRLLVKFEADALDPAVPSVAGQGLVESVTAADPATIVVSLAPGVGSFRASAVPLDAGSSRVVIDVLPAGAPAQVPAPPGLVSLPGAAHPEPLPAFSQASPSIRTIVLDPGHGGEEIGARGVNGAMEKDITLDVARRLKAAIEARLGIRVLLTREDDRLVPLDDRASIANNNKADLLISLHVNASPHRDARGAEVFYLSLDGLSAETRRMAENPPGKTLPTLGGGSRDIELILWETAQARHLAESAVLAGFIEEELRKSIEMSLRSLQQASFRVLVGANMPAVLVEIGFVSNPDQEAQLITDGYKNQVVQAIYDAISRYRARLAGARQERR